MNNGMKHVDVEIAFFLGTLMSEMCAYCGVSHMEWTTDFSARPQSPSQPSLYLTGHYTDFLDENFI
jgi:hypothetical protein